MIGPKYRFNILQKLSFFKFRYLIKHRENKNESDGGREREGGGIEKERKEDKEKVCV